MALLLSNVDADKITEFTRSQLEWSNSKGQYVSCSLAEARCAVVIFIFWRILKLLPKTSVPHHHPY